MTNEEARAVLGRMAAEHRSWDQQMAANKHVGGVLEAFEAALKGFPALEQRKNELTGELNGLQSQYDAELRKMQQRNEEEKQRLTAALDPLKQRLADASAAATRAEGALADKEKFVAARSKQLDEEIRAKSQELENLKKGIEELKKKHGLAG
jgi:chromosome segregation ATPase